MASEIPVADIPISSFADWVLSKLRQHASEGKVAQIFADDGSSWTYDELLRHSVHVAAGLESLGIKSGDMVSLVTRNSHQLFAVVLGCIFADVIVTPSIPELAASELRQNFLTVRPKYIIAGEPSIPAVEDAINGTDDLNPKPKIFELKQLFKDVTSKGSTVDPATYKPVHITDPKSHVFSCMFSSGTTGRQKAMTLSDYGVLRAMHLSVTGFAKRCSGPYISTSQANWASWWFGIIRCLILGWTRVFLNKVDIYKFLDAVHTFKPDIWIGLPSLISSMSTAIDENPGRWDTSSLILMVTGGEGFSKGPQEYLSKKLKVDIHQIFSSTEAGTVFRDPVDTPAVYGSIGIPTVPVKLVDVSTGEEVTKPNHPGEIVIKSLATNGYYNNPDANAENFDEKGWFKTGDVAVFDENGYFFIVDRIKEMFKYKGFQISPHELEDIIHTIPGVKEAAVVGKYVGVDTGHVPVAFVVRENDSKITESDIEKHLEKENLHDSKKLRGGVIFIDRLPKNATGKTLRVELRNMVNKS